MTKAQKIIKLASVKVLKQKYTLSYIARQVGCSRQYVKQVINKHLTTASK